MAERMAAKYAAEFGFHTFKATSAGTAAVSGHHMHPDMARVLEGYGGDPSNFVARQVTSSIALNADLVLTMTRDHRDAVLAIAPQQLRKTFTLIEAARLASECNVEGIADLERLRPRLAHEPLDIPDPIGHGPDIHAAVGSQIVDLLVPVMKLLSHREL